jgi:hypothetical protein
MLIPPPPQPTSSSVLIDEKSAVFTKARADGAALAFILRRKVSSASGEAVEKSSFPLGAPLRMDSAVPKFCRHRIAMAACRFPTYEGSPLTRFIRVRKTSVFLGQEFRSNEHIKKKAQSGRTYAERGGKLLGGDGTRLQRREQVELHTREHREPGVDGESQLAYGFRFGMYVCHGLTSAQPDSGTSGLGLSSTVLG